MHRDELRRTKVQMSKRTTASTGRAVVTATATIRFKQKSSTSRGKPSKEGKSERGS